MTYNVLGGTLNLALLSISEYAYAWVESGTLNWPLLNQPCCEINYSVRQASSLACYDM